MCFSLICSKFTYKSIADLHVCVALLTNVVAHENSVTGRQAGKQAIQGHHAEYSFKCKHSIYTHCYCEDKLLRIYFY